ncbi:hypothetical protein IWW37_001374 [Coemansia sp. RSA 2050]|nr:hypothetical protein IWW37_001374 [Coemansia sp. RSA 2050]
MTSDLPETPPDEHDGSGATATVASSTSKSGAKGGGVDSYIASLHLERSNTRAATPSTLQRRKTLMKQASDPTADQAALELEIRQVERLASLLGRRQTKFDGKRGRPTVNHDLDATLEGFFDVQDDENERVADILLSGTHSAAVYSLGRDDLGGGVENPELKHANIRSAPATLIATQFEPEYGQAVDLFDRIDEMHLAKSPSGSAEYLPLDSYNGEGSGVSVSGTSAVPELAAILTGGSSSSHIARGKAADIADQDFNADSPISDDGVLAGITRSSTWKRQSMLLIQERDRLGPALPQLPNDLDEDDELPEEEKAHVSTADQNTLPENLPVAVAPVPLAPTSGTDEEGAPSMEGAFVTGMYPTDDAPNTAVVTDYYDILDFIDAKEHSDIGASRNNDDEDGHISSDLLANSDTSDIDLSDDDSDSSDSDDQYLSRISQQRVLRVANVVNAPRPHTSHHARHASSGSIQQPIDSTPMVDQRSSVIVPDAEANNGVGLVSHSTLRRNRRILTKGKSIRRGSLNRQSTRTQPVVSTQPTEASLNPTIPESKPLGGTVPSPRWSVAGGDEPMLAAQRANSPLAHPAAHSAVAPARAVVVSSTRPDSLFSAGRGGPPAEPAPMAAAASPASPGVPAPMPGLAKLAEAAHAAAAAATLPGTRTNRGLSVSAIGGARHKPLPPVPDRLSCTLQAADDAAAAAATAAASVTQETLAASSNTAAARPGRAAPPPLPAKARPKIPQALAGDRLGTRAAIAAALERPSSQTLFGVGQVRAYSQQASLEHMAPVGAPGMHRAATTQPALPAAGASPLGLQAWLQRTDILAPANDSTSAKPAPSLTIAESVSMPLERPASQQTYTPRPMTAARRKSMRARSRVVRKVAVPSLPLQEPPPPPSLRPASSHSSIHSSASHENGPSQPTSPDLVPNSQTVALEHSPMASSVSTTATQDACPYPYSHEYEPIQTVSGPTVLSEPPGSELLEPSAPMLLEPTAPELPEQWDIVSPHSYAFPQPMHYEIPSAPQYAYGAVPGMAPRHAQMGFALPPLTPPQLHMYAAPPSQSQAHTMPLATVPSAMLSPALSHQRPGPPKLPEKPRPLLSGGAGRRPMSVPSTSRPQSLAHSGMAPTTQTPDRTSAPVSNIGTPLASPLNDYVMVEEDEKARLSAIYNEYQRTEPAASTTALSCDDSARPSRNSSLLAKPPQSPSALPPLSVNTHAQVPPSAATTAAITDTALTAPTPFVDPAADVANQDALSSVEDPVLEVRDKERQRETKRKAALFELVDTERSYTNDLRMVVELFLLPIQLLGNRKIVDVIFGDMVKITEMNGKMYIDMITRLGPLACKVDPERANRNRRKKKNAIRPSGVSHLSGPSRSVLQGSTLRSPTSPSVSISASTTMSRRLSNSNNTSHGDQQRSARRSSVHSYSDATMSLDNMSISQTASRNGDRASVVSNGDDLSIATSHSGGSGGDASELRYLATTTAIGGSTLPAERHDSMRSLGSASEEDENDASKWTEDQVLDYFKNVCIGDVMSNYLKDFSEHYAQYSANHDKAIEYLKLVRESSSRLNLRSDATRDAHQKLLQTLERAEKDTRVRRLRLESFLLSPVQRVMRYPLLLEALLKYTPEDHPDHEDVALALSIAGSVATEVDRKSEELVNRQRLAELQSTFDWAHLLGGVQLKLDTFTKLVGQRKFVRKGPLRKASSGKHLYAILFNDFMMITVSDRRGGVWCYEPYRLPIQTYDLLARDPAKDQFELVNLKNSEVLQLRADTPAEASDWVKDIMKTANYCYDVMCEALTAGIQVSKVKSVISQEAREKILQGGKPAVLSKRN